jgi:hypothetical protein
MVDEDLAHGFRSDRQEMRAIGVARICVARELQVGLVYEGRRLQRVVGALLLHVVMRKASQLLVDEARHLVERRPVTPAPGVQELRHFRDGGRLAHRG